MEQYIKTYATKDNYNDSFGELIAPSVAFIEDFDGSGNSMTRFSADYSWAENILLNEYSSLLQQLANDVEKLKKGGNIVYLNSTEYDKLVRGEVAVDEHGDVIETTWDDPDITYAVFDDDENQNVNTDTSGEVDEDDYLEITNAGEVDEDGYLEIIGGEVDEDGYLNFTQNVQPIIPDTDMEVDDENYLAVADAEIDNENYLVLDNVTISDGYLEI